MSSVVGTASYANGEQEFFTDPNRFIQTVRDELPNRSTSGFTYQVMTASAATRKAVDDLAYNEYGEENPHELAYYQDTEAAHQEQAEEALNTALYKKMYAEQDSYRGWLLTQTPEEILHHTYEYTVREDILMSMEENDLDIEQASALLMSPSPLGDVFSEFEHRESSYMEDVLDCITCRANEVIQAEENARIELLQLSVYPHPATYAHEHEELPQYRASHKANIACRDAIDAAIADNYRNNALGRDAVKKVVEQFGYDRVLYVLAETIQHKDWDGRISHANKEWAATLSITADKDSWGGDRNAEFVVDRTHTGLVDLFATQARREYLLTQPLSKEDIQHEATRMLQRLQEPQKPNSPSGTHYMVQISPDFLIRASGKDKDELYAMLPFSSLAFTALADRKGLYATISKDEDRCQSLRERKPSVRKQLGDTAAQPKPPQTKSPHKSEPEL